MDEGILEILLYLGLIIGMGVLSAITSKNKNKQKNVPQPSDEEENMMHHKDVEMTFEDIVEQIKNKQTESQSVLQTSEVVSAPDIKSHIYNKEVEQEKNLKRKREQDSRFAKLMEDFEESDHNSRVVFKEFNLRDAIIASEILNRKY